MRRRLDRSYQSSGSESLEKSNKFIFIRNTQPTLDGVTAAYLAHWRLSEKEKRASSRNDKKCMGSAFVPGKGQILQLDATKLLRNQQSDREVPRGGSKTAVACRVVFSDVICWSQCKF